MYSPSGLSSSPTNSQLLEASTAASYEDYRHSSHQHQSDCNGENDIANDVLRRLGRLYDHRRTAGMEMRVAIVGVHDSGDGGTEVHHCCEGGRSGIGGNVKGGERKQRRADDFFS